MQYNLNKNSNRVLLWDLWDSLKIPCTSKGPRKANTIMEIMEEELALLGIKTYYTVIVIKMVCHCFKKIMDEWNRSETDPYIYGNNRPPCFKTSGEKMSMIGTGNWLSIWKREKIKPLACPIYKDKFQNSKGLNVKSKALVLIEKIYRYQRKKQFLKQDAQKAYTIKRSFNNMTSL